MRVGCWLVDDRTDEGPALNGTWNYRYHSISDSLPCHQRYRFHCPEQHPFPNIHIHQLMGSFAVLAQCLPTTAMPALRKWANICRMPNWTVVGLIHYTHPAQSLLIIISKYGNDICCPHPHKYLTFSSALICGITGTEAQRGGSAETQPRSGCRNSLVMLNSGVLLGLPWTWNH